MNLQIPGYMQQRVTAVQVIKKFHLQPLPIVVVHRLLMQAPLQETKIFLAGNPVAFTATLPTGGTGTIF
ncbi:MAG: hypothetical protein IPI46_11695 [Bacteroidetes bacterium]|nr:hypothetical protein [Bacteroidota bacterium]